MAPKKPTEVKNLSVELVGKVFLNSRDRKPYYGNAIKLGMRKIIWLLSMNSFIMHTMRRVYFLWKSPFTRNHCNYLRTSNSQRIKNSNFRLVSIKVHQIYWAGISMPHFSHFPLPLRCCSGKKGEKIPDIEHLLW